PPSPDYVPGLEHPPSPDYVPGLEHPPSPVEIPYVPELEYPVDLEPSDDEAPLEDQPLPTDASPITASPDYVDGDDETSDDDDDDDTDDKDPEEEPFEDEEDDEEEGEHLAPTDPPVVPIVDPVLPARDAEALEADELTHAPGSPIIIPLSQTPALPSPPLPIPSPPLPLPSPLTTSPTDTGAPLGYRVAGIRMRALLPSTSRKIDIPEADMPPRKRVCLTTPAPGFEIKESSTTGAARQPGPIESDLRRCRQMMDEFEIRFEEAQDNRALLRTRVNTMLRDRPDHRRTAMLIDREAMYAREA
nr:hypothetical protein [Tanacetum cinerariifolium]